MFEPCIVHQQLNPTWGRASYMLNRYFVPSGLAKALDKTVMQYHLVWDVSILARLVVLAARDEFILGIVHEDVEIGVRASPIVVPA